MAKLQNPFYKSKLECPVCKAVNEFDVIRQGAFTESGRDTDFMPIGREWTNPAYQKYNPLAFFIASCKRCYYSREFNASYKEWNSDTNFKSYKLPSQAKKHLDELNSDTSILAKLGRKIDLKNSPFEAAVTKLLLAIYDEKLMDRPASLDIARYFLRIAWLYREKGDKTDGGDPAEMLLSSIQIEINRLKNDISGFADHLPPLQGSITRDFEQVLKPDEQNDITAKLKNAVENVQRVWMDLDGDVEKLQTVFDQVKKEINLVRTEITGKTGKIKLVDFREFLYSIKEKMAEVPVNEIEALSLALEYYLKAYQSSREIKAGLQQLQAAYLIAELSRRINSMSQAGEYFKNASKMAQDLMIKNRNDKTIFSNAQKIFEMSLEQGRIVRRAVKVKA
ncbi:MAG: DUF2225 domain-containing protein [candidate division Zixibacteria bacterium]